MKSEFKIITRKHWCRSLAENYPDLTEEADMRPRELLELGYQYEELIDRRETPYLPCTVRLEGDHYAVFTKCKDGLEWLGNVPRNFEIDELVTYADPIVRVDGGQKIKVVEGKNRDKVEEVGVPYSFVLVFRNVFRLK